MARLLACIQLFTLMGLDTSHDCWHGAYSAFHRWRCKIAEVAGLPPLELMEGFWISPRDERVGTGLSLTIRVAANSLKTATYQWAQKRDDEDERDRPHERLLSAFDFEPIRWDCLKADPLHELLHHSDCAGVIPSSSCAAIAARLTELIPLLPDETAGGHIGNWREKTTQFRDGLLLAASKGEDVDFH